MQQTLGPYELRGELGRGAMAVVWRAWDPKLEREVAIKEPLAPASAVVGDLADEFAERFVREGKAAAQLNHPGIVTIYNADVYEGRPAIVMELIEGQTLGEVLACGPLDPALTLSVLDQLLDAVGYAHSRGVVHRDIKPDNVFVTGDGRVKLTDFGIAHVGTGTALTQAGTIMGTPGYMAPEQVRGESVDSRADIFAIGVIAYELMTGRNPFGATEGTAPTTVMYRIVHEAPPQLEAAALVPAHVLAATQTALSKDPAARFPDAASFRAALHGAASTQLGSSAPPGHHTEPTRVPRWLPYAAVAIVGVVVVGILLVAATSIGPGGGIQDVGTAATSNQEDPEDVSTVPAAETPSAEELESSAGDSGASFAQEEGPPDRATAESDIRSLLEAWRTSRERLDFTSYVSFYAPDFYSAEDNLPYDQWYERKRQIYQTTSAPSVSLGSPSFMWSTDGYLATVSFDQTYRSGSVNEDGTKTLQVAWSEGAWRIVSEDYVLHRTY